MSLGKRRRICLQGCLGVQLFPVGQSETRPTPEQPLDHGSDCEARDHIAGPVRQQNDPRQNEARPDRPGQVALRRRQHRSGRCQRADMDGMAGWKGVEWFSRKRHAVKKNPANPSQRDFGGARVRRCGGRNADIGKPGPGLIVPVVAWFGRFTDPTLRGSGRTSPG